ncbi:MAG: hypothetical protein AAFV53_33290 [Myxococcota bacterium]
MTSSTSLIGVIGFRILEWMKERVTDPILQRRSLEETRAMLRLLALAMRADGTDTPAERNLYDYLLARIPKSWRSSDGAPLWQAIELELIGLPDEAARLNVARKTAIELQDPELRRKVYQMLEMIFQAEPTNPVTYRRWHAAMGEALQIPPDEQERLAADAASDYEFRVRREVESLQIEDS